MGYLLIDDEKATNLVETAAATTTKAALKADQSRSNDAASSSCMFVSHPSEMDVLCGQDKNFIQHPGNRLYRSLIATWSERYGQTNGKQSKMRMTTEICEHMKKTYESRFLKPTPIMVMDGEGEAAVESRKSNTYHVREAAGSSSTTTDLGAFRWKVLTDQAARDKISHALRTAASASRKRQERRKRVKAAQKKEQQKQQQQHQPTHSEQKQKQQQQHQQHQQNAYQPQARFLVDEPWTSPHPSMHHDHMTLSFSTGTPPHAVWRHEQTTDSHTTAYELLPMSSPVSFDGSIDTTTSSSWSSSLHFLGDTDSAVARHAGTTDGHNHHLPHHWNDSQDYEPLPWSSCRGSFTLSTEMATSLSQILSDDSDFSCADW